MIKTAEINERLLEDLPVIRLPKFVSPGAGLSIWWIGDDRIAFQFVSAGGGIPGGGGGGGSQPVRRSCQPPPRDR